MELKNKRIHFIGIGGVSMKALAELCSKKDSIVSGSDLSEANIEYLVNKQIFAYSGVDSDFIDGVDLVVYSSAIKEDNEELVKAKARGIQCLERSEFINILAQECTTNVFVSGCHGKSTTTGIICNTLEKNNKKFIGLCGSDYINKKTNLIYTGEDILVSEACEYKKNFLKFTPDVLVVLNVEFDHPDSYKDFEDMLKTYTILAKKTNKRVIAHESLRQYFIGVGIENLITFGYNTSSDYYVNNVIEDNDGTSFSVYYDNHYVERVKVKLHGVENCLNFLASYIVLDLLGIKEENIFNSFELFPGIKRRFEKLGRVKESTIIIDYAHHPTEIAFAIKNARKITRNKLWVVFEPHTYSRTKSMMKEFADVLKLADSLIVLPTYSAREKLVDNMDISKTLYESVNLSDKVYIENYDEVKKYLGKKIAPNDVVLILGAGDVYKIGYRLLDN